MPGSNESDASRPGESRGAGGGVANAHACALEENTNCSICSPVGVADFIFIKSKSFEPY